MNYDLEFLYNAIWRPPYDTTVERPLSYIKRLHIKQQAISESIKYLISVIADPETSESTRESVSRLLLGYQRTRKIYEIQGSILAA